MHSSTKWETGKWSSTSSWVARDHLMRPWTRRRWKQ
jgi:hypothetical protein